ncbi:MAG: hypothetical protein IJF75_04845 [Clostridia bacterium]|nr:hypothetical protein [Clostridia bacterium]
MLIYNLISAVSIVFLAILTIFIIVKIFFLNRAQRIEFIRGFKKGNCAIIYFVVLPLYVAGRLFGGENFFFALFNSIHNVVKLVILQFDLSGVKALIEANSLYAFTVYFSFVLVVINALLFTISLVSQRVWAFIGRIKFRLSSKEKLIVVGNNDHNIDIYNTFSGSKVLISELDEKECFSLYVKNVKYVDLKSFSDLSDWLKSNCKKAKSKISVILNFGNDEKNISLSREIIDFVKESGNDELLFSFGAYVFGDPRFETVYTSLASESNGCLHYVNKYHQIAVDFVDKYPLTKFLSEEHIDTKTACLKDGVDLNVCFIGFGNTNQQILSTSVANNQFIKKGETEPELKQVNYHIFDKQYSENNKNLNHSYFRFKNEFNSVDVNNYLPLPDLPANEKFYRLDINDKEYYKSLKDIFTNNIKSVNYVIIAFGTDLENIDMARKLSEKRREWNLANLHIFVKVRDKKLYESTSTMYKNIDFKPFALYSINNCSFTKNSDVCYVFAVEKDVVYNFDRISNEKFSHMAKMRDAMYAVEYKITSEKLSSISNEAVEKIERESLLSWYKVKTELERESNLYAVLSIRAKLNLIGLDFEDVSSETQGIDFDEYLSIYAKGNLPDFKHYNVTVDKKPIIYYPFAFPDSLRKNLAVHEHLRWNSFMISKGMVPASIEQIRNEVTIKANGKEAYTNGKNYVLRRHGNLTTFGGLMQFSEIVAKRDGVSVADKDVFKYDYQLLDDAYWLLTANGFKIVKRK